ncbi:MAG: hypothetical protein ACRD44_03565, partial [Bryobacteraceae bacterium]
MRTIAFFWCLSALPAQDGLARRSGPDTLTFDELVALSDTALPEGAMAAKLDTLLKTPSLSNEAHLDGARPHRPSRDGVGPLLRTVFWNIERGHEFELIRLAFSGTTPFVEEAARR